MNERQEWTEKIINAIDATRGHGGKPNYTAASRLLGVHRETVHRAANRIEKTGIDTAPIRYTQENLKKTPTLENLNRGIKDVIQKAFDRSGKNLKTAAQSLGTTPQNLAKQIKKIEQGKPVYTDKRDARKATEKIFQAPKPLRGKESEPFKVTKGKGYKITYYKVKPGEAIPSHGEQARYQVVGTSKKREVNLGSLNKDVAKQIKTALEKTGGNRKEAAKLLGVDPKKFDKWATAVKNDRAIFKDPQKGLKAIEGSKIKVTTKPRRVSGSMAGSPGEALSNYASASGNYEEDTGDDITLSVFELDDFERMGETE